MIRDAGTFGTIDVGWSASQNTPADLSPTSDIMQFLPGQAMAFIEISSLPDEVGKYYCSKGSWLKLL